MEYGRLVTTSPSGLPPRFLTDADFNLHIVTVLLIWACSAHEEWHDQFVYLPL